MRNNPQPLFWVCVFAAGQQMHFEMTANIQGLLCRIPQSEQLLYFRTFANVLDAAAHRLLLENLDPDFCRRQMRVLNPRLKDLRPAVELMQQ